MKKHLLALILGLCFGFPLFARSMAIENNTVEKIDAFDVIIKIDQDASIKVEEAIQYDFGPVQKHGIYRDIPVRYKARGGNFSLRLGDVSVSDEMGNSYQFSISSEGDNERIKIGDADTFVSGKKTYVIDYTISRAINYFNDHDELYWNATGNEWLVPIENSSTTVILPEKLDQSAIKSACFAGIRGTQNGCGEKQFKDPMDSKSDAVVFKNGFSQPGEGLTVVVGFPKGMVKKPTLVQQIVQVLADNWIMFTPLITLAVLYWLWRRFGRDPKGRGTIIAQYEAPDNLTPTEVGTIIDERADNADVSAEIINLAVKGYLKINRTEEKGILSNKKGYRLDQLKQGTDLDNDFEKNFLEKLFSYGSSIPSGSEEENKKVLSSVNLSDLDDKFYKDIAEIKQKIYASVVEKGYFQSNPNTIRGIYLTFGVIFLFLSFFIGFSIGTLAMFSLALSAVLVIIFSFIMPKKTKKGVEAKENILGLKQYLQVAEKDRIEFHNAPEKSPQVFEKLLPFAMVLKVEKQWAKQFEGIYNQPPSWYNDPSGAAFSAMYFADSLNDFSSAASTNLTSAPSSAASGGSGFSGGGGGGFGGGGGGSW